MAIYQGENSTVVMTNYHALLVKAWDQNRTTLTKSQPFSACRCNESASWKGGFETRPYQSLEV
jgi:hypothetical protein